MFALCWAFAPLCAGFLLFLASKQHFCYVVSGSWVRTLHYAVLVWLCLAWLGLACWLACVLGTTTHIICSTSTTEVCTTMCPSYFDRSHSLSLFGFKRLEWTREGLSKPGYIYIYIYTHIHTYIHTYYIYILCIYIYIYTYMLYDMLYYIIVYYHMLCNYIRCSPGAPWPPTSGDLTDCPSDPNPVSMQACELLKAMISEERFYTPPPPPPRGGGV